MALNATESLNIETDSLKNVKILWFVSKKFWKCCVCDATFLSVY